MTLTYERDLGSLLQRCVYIPKMQFPGQGFQKLKPQTEQTDGRDRTYYHSAFAGGNYTRTLVFYWLGLCTDASLQCCLLLSLTIV